MKLSKGFPMEGLRGQLRCNERAAHGVEEEASHPPGRQQKKKEPCGAPTFHVVAAATCFFL